MLSSILMQLHACFSEKRQEAWANCWRLRVKAASHGLNTFSYCSSYTVVDQNIKRHLTHPQKENFSSLHLWFSHYSLGLEEYIGIKTQDDDGNARNRHAEGRFGAMKNSVHRRRLTNT